MKSGKWQGVQVRDQGRSRVAHYVFMLAKCDTRDCRKSAVSRERIHKRREGLLGLAAHHQVNKRIGAHRWDIDNGRLGATQHDRGLRMRSLDLSGDAQRYGVTAANGAEAEKVEAIKIASGEVRSGKAAKISFIAIRIPEPLIVNAIEVHNFRLQAFGLKHGGKAKDADRRKLAHDPGCFYFAHGPLIELVGCRRTDETNLHGSHLFGRRMNESGSFPNQNDPLSNMSI
jgi:hypothetical protein